MTAKKNPPFRYDIVGSFLRPAALKKQRAAAARGEISAAALARQRTRPSATSSRRKRPPASVP
jgi:5-methyltetrahydropteroyltriglutamate--homocysteine methyltransferase